MAGWRVDHELAAVSEALARRDEKPDARRVEESQLLAFEHDVRGATLHELVQGLTKPRCSRDIDLAPDGHGRDMSVDAGVEIEIRHCPSPRSSGVRTTDYDDRRVIAQTARREDLDFVEATL